MASIKNKKILVHSCCAPCATFVLQTLIDSGAKVVSFFYNPNIHGRAEYERRRDSMEKFAREIGVKLIIPKYDMREYFDALYNYEKKHYRNIEYDKKKRCDICYRLRLEKTALFAKKEDFAYFTTTLLISPFQDQSRIWQIGAEIGEEEGIPFYFRDFRKGYLESRHKAKRFGLYLQKYCGCSYSAMERIRQKERVKK